MGVSTFSKYLLRLPFYFHLIEYELILRMRKIGSIHLLLLLPNLSNLNIDSTHARYESILHKAADYNRTTLEIRLSQIF